MYSTLFFFSSELSVFAARSYTIFTILKCGFYGLLSLKALSIPICEPKNMSICMYVCMIRTDNLSIKS